MPFHERPKRWAVLVVHRRAGKTVSAINDLIKGALTCPHPSPRFAYVAPTYSQAKDVAWGYLKRYTEPIAGRVVSEGELHVTMSGDRRVRLYGADNYDRMRGIYLDGCVVDEPADMAPEAWTDVISPALSDRRGWCVWIGTPKGRDAFYRLWRDAASDPNWFTMLLPASQSGVLPPEELKDAKHRMRSSKGAYEREYECSFDTPVAGSIYGDLLTALRGAGRVLSFEWDRSAPVFAAWDLGFNDATSVWLFQIVGRDINWIWHTRQQGKNAAQMAIILNETEIPIATHYTPHDVESKHATTGTNYRMEMTKAGLRNIVTVPRPVWIWPGINALRNIIPRSVFRIPQCALGIEALEAYHSKDTTDGSVVVQEPIHDWSSHDADAARIAAEALELGLVRPMAAKRFVELPKYPDGARADVDTVRQMRNNRRAEMSFSGPRDQ